MTDMVYSIAMKSSNQHGESGFKRTFVPFLDQVRTTNEMQNFYQQAGGGDGIKQVTDANTMWARVLKLYPSALLDGVKKAMQANSLDNAYTVSKSSGWYVLAKQVFEFSDIFEAFLKAIAKNTDLIVESRFDPQGAVARRPVTNRFLPGMLRKGGKLFVWDAPGNAFTYQDQSQSWAAIDIATINIHHAA